MVIALLLLFALVPVAAGLVVGVVSAALAAQGPPRLTHQQLRWRLHAYRRRRWQGLGSVFGVGLGTAGIAVLVWGLALMAMQFEQTRTLPSTIGPSDPGGFLSSYGVDLAMWGPAGLVLMAVFVGIGGLLRARRSWVELDADVHCLRARTPAGSLELPWAEVREVRHEGHTLTVIGVDAHWSWPAPDAATADLAQVAEWLDAARARGLAPPEAPEPPPELQRLRSAPGTIRQ